MLLVSDAVLVLLGVDLERPGIFVAVVGQQLGPCRNGATHPVHDLALDLDGHNVLVPGVVGRVDDGEPVNLRIRVRARVDVANDPLLVRVHQLPGVAGLSALVVVCRLDYLPSVGAKEGANGYRTGGVVEDAASGVLDGGRINDDQVLVLIPNGRVKGAPLEELLSAGVAEDEVVAVGHDLLRVVYLLAGPQGLSLKIRLRLFIDIEVDFVRKLGLLLGDE